MFPDVHYFSFFSLHKGFLTGTLSFGKPAVTQKNLLVLSSMQVKQPKKHDSYNKLIPYTSSPIPCVCIINLKRSLFTVGTSSCYSFVPCLKEQDAAVSPSHLVGNELMWLLPQVLLPWSCPSCSCGVMPQLPTYPTHPPVSPAVWQLSCRPALGTPALGFAGSCGVFCGDLDTRSCHGRCQRLWYKCSGTPVWYKWKVMIICWVDYISSYFHMYTCTGMWARTDLPFKSGNVSKYTNAMEK